MPWNNYQFGETYNNGRNKRNINGEKKKKTGATIYLAKRINKALK